MIGYYLLAAIVYIVGGTITYKKQHCPTVYERVHYQGDRPDTLYVKDKTIEYKPKTQTNDTTKTIEQ